MELGALVKDQYQIIEHIGRGGMADVWSARDTRLRRMVAIKTIAHGLTEEVDPVQLFEREAQTIAQMEHPHILPIYDFGEYDNSLYIVMRYVTSGSLEDRLRNGGLEPREVLRIGRSIAQALDHAHANNVIHLDLKPPNILLDSAQTPYLADFGLATVLDPEGRARNPGSGTLLYMAPEQLVAETIDHRADIYSFSIMLYHMFTGQLPFAGAQPLALRQLQANVNLPDDIVEIHKDFPYEVIEILRRGTAQEPKNRPDTLIEIVEQLNDAIFGLHTNDSIEYDPFADLSNDSASALTNSLIKSGDDTLLEAVDIYTRARHVWAGGQGRFLLGLTHFMLMSEYYADAITHGLTIDESGHQMLLRGALEYDYQIDYWWGKVTEIHQRLVALHTLRTGTASARIRALYRLEALPDDPTNPMIPKLVGQALEVENDEEAQLAALNVLRTRAKLLKPYQSVEIDTRFRGRLLSTAMRMGIQVLPPSEWREAIYSPEIDLLIANHSFNEDSPAVAEYAARTVGQMRSLTAVRFLANAQRAGRVGALKALAYVRDEAPALPGIVSPQARFYAWLTNTLNRLTTHPLEGILRFVLALIGGWIGMGQIIYITYRSQSLFTPQRWGNTLAIGLVFGLFVALTVGISDEASRRLQGFWSWWLRLLVFGSLGFLMGILTWAGFTWMYLQYIPLWDVMRLAGFALAFGFVTTALLGLYGWRSLVLTTLINFIAVYALHQGYYESNDFSVTWVAPLGLVVGGIIGWLTSYRLALADHIDLPGKLPVRIGLAITMGLVWVGLSWTTIFFIYRTAIPDGSFTWDGVLAFFVSALFAGALLMYWLNAKTRFAFMATSLFGFLAVFANVGWLFSDYDLVLPALGTLPLSITYLQGTPFAPPPETPIIYFDDPTRMPFIILPMLFVIAVGANGTALWRNWWRFVGKPHQHQERNTWATGGLVYAFVLMSMVSLLALFSAHIDVAWALGWGLWGFVGFVATMALWRWALWGGRLMFLVMVGLLIGGFLYDIKGITDALALGQMPSLFTAQADLGGQTSVPFWAFIAIGVAIFIVGAFQRRLWGGIGLLALIPVWFMISLFTPIEPSMTILTLIHVGFFAVVLQNIWDKLEPQRWQWQRMLPATPSPRGSATDADVVAVAHEIDAHDAHTIQGVYPANDTELAPDLMPSITLPDDDDALVIAEFDELSFTELDAGAHLGGELDREALDTEAPRIRFNTTPDLSKGDDEKDGESIPRIRISSDPKTPRIKLDTGALDAGKVGTQLDARRQEADKKANQEGDQEGDKEDASLTEASPRIRISSVPKAPRIKLDTGALDAGKVGTQLDARRQEADKKANQEGDKEDASLTEASPRIRISSDPKTPRIKLDTGALDAGKVGTQLDARQQAQDDDISPPEQPNNDDAVDVPEDNTPDT